jgi:hypothetical protein
MTTGSEENRIARVELVDEMRATARRVRECAERMKATPGVGVLDTDASKLCRSAATLEDTAYSIEIDRRRA